MSLSAHTFTNSVPRRVLTLTAVCAFVGAALCLTLPMRAQQSSVPRAIVRHGFTVNGRIEGSVQQLSGEDTTVNSGGVLTGDLFVPGSPTVEQNGHPTFGGTGQGSGVATPSNYRITLNGNAQLGRVVTRTDPAALPSVAIPPASAGTRDVTLNAAGQSAGDFSTVRHLTLNGNTVPLAVPPGTYQRLTVNGGSVIVLGVAGASQPAVYNLDSLVLNGNSRLDVVGPVVLTTASAVTVGGAMGSSAHPLWLSLKVASGGVTLNGGSALYAAVSAPSGTVTINGDASLTGALACDRLTINGNGLLRLVQTDTTPPLVTIQQPAGGTVTGTTQLTVTGTFSDESQTTITVNGVNAAVSGDTFTAVVPLVEGANLIRARAIDNAGNSSEATANVTLDTTTPGIVIEQPLGGSATNSQQLTVAGTVGDATATTVTVNGMSAARDGNRFTASVVLAAEGPYDIVARATDAAGNVGETSVRVARDMTPPAVNVAEPADRVVSSQRIVNVSGTVSDSSRVSVFANGTPLDVTNGGFAGQVALSEGESTLTILAADAAGNTRESSRTLIIDTLPPVISELSPAQGTTVASPATTVRGRVADTTAVSITLNNVAAVVASDGSFVVENVPVAEGENRFVVAAADAAGHIATADLVLSGKDRTPPPAPTLLPVNSPTRLDFLTLEGSAEPGSTVTVAGGAEPIVTRASMGTGMFTAIVSLARGNNSFSVTAADPGGNTSAPAALSVVSDPSMQPPAAGHAAQINISTGNSQRGLIGAELPRPLIAIVTDRDGSPVANAAVRFTVQQGGGHFVGAGASLDASTDAEGRARALYVTGTASRVQQVRADFSGNAATPAVFLAEALEATAGETTVSGVVLDQNLRGLPNVLVRIGGQQTRTTADGRFKLGGVATGPHQLLELIGRDQVSLPGRWPNITYDFDVLPGVANDLGRPLFLPKVNDGVALPLDNSSVITQDTVFELPVAGGEAPVRVTARAGTRVTFPPDVTDKRLSVTRIATNRTPMVLEDGRAAGLYISVQPSGAIFSPPLEISFPNVDRLAPAREVLLMSFDHDAGRYIKVGTGHVSADGQRVASDSGSGIRTGAWHALPPEDPDPEVTVLGHIQLKDNPAFENKVILDAEAWVEGTRAVITSAPDAEDFLDFKATFTMPRNAPPRQAKMEATINAIPVEVDFDAEGKTPDGEIVRTTSSGAPAYTLLAMAEPPARPRRDAVSDGPTSLLSSAAPQSPGAPEHDLGVFYGGSKNETSDELAVIVTFGRNDSLLTPKKVVWSMTGPGSEIYAPPRAEPGTKRWQVGKLLPKPGELKIKAIIYFTAAKYGPPVVAQAKVEVGIRSDDIVAIAWINPDAVPLPAGDANEDVLQFYPPGGMHNASTTQKYLTLAHLGSIAAGFANRPVPAYFDPITHFPIFRPLTVEDRIYILDWMFKYGSNPCSEQRCPPTSFPDESTLYAFQIAHKTSYKLFNRFQIKYRVENGKFKEIPIVEKRAAEIGVTIEPIFGEEAPGADGSNNDQFSNVDNAFVRLINDGNPESVAVSAFNTLTAPFEWNNIGSRIELGVDLGTTKRIYTQVYPTYYIFDNRTRTQTIPQARAPIGNFTRSPSKPHIP